MKHTENDITGAKLLLIGVLFYLFLFLYSWGIQ